MGVGVGRKVGGRRCRGFASASASGVEDEEGWEIGEVEEVED